jgi:two-component system NtrC family sensor kinase
MSGRLLGSCRNRGCQESKNLLYSDCLTDSAGQLVAERGKGRGMSGERILVVDDRRENLLFLANDVLRPEGYEVITAIDGKQALDKALAERPDLIVTDLKLPRLSGLELMEALRKEQVDIPVILTTFYGSEQAAIQAFRLGAKDYMVKPYEIREMLKSVERALIEQRLRRETMDLKEGVQVSHHLEERVRQLHSLCSIGKALAGLQDPAEVMRVSVEASLYLTGAENGQLFLIDSKTKKVELRALRESSEARARCLREPGTDDMVLQVMQTGRPVFTDPSGEGEDAAPRLAVPLRLKSKILGVFALDSKRDQAFSDNDRYLMGILADFAAVNLSNAQMIEELKGEREIQPGRADEQPDDTAGALLASALAESIAEAERLSRELQNLASAAQMLAAKLQVQSEPGGETR